MCDFGFAKAIESQAMITSIKGTPLYMAPELIKEQPYNKKADLWSLGAIIYELIVGQPPFYANSYPKLISKIQKENVKYPSFISDELKDFLKTLLRKNPKERPDWPEISDHPFVRENRTEMEEKYKREKEYIKWIKRIRRENIFHLNDSVLFKNKIFDKKEMVNDELFRFDANNESPALNANDRKLVEGNLSHWLKIEQMSQKEDGVAELWKNSRLCDNIIKAFELLIKDSALEDVKMAVCICKVIFNLLNKSKSNSNPTDIEQRTDILDYIFLLFRLGVTNSYTDLIGEAIKIIGLYAKHFCYTFKGIDHSFCSNYLKFHNVIFSKNFAAHINVNYIKTSSIIVAAANVNPKKSVVFYKSLSELKFIKQLFTLISNKQGSPLILIRSSLECLSLLFTPMNGELHQFPIVRKVSTESSHLNRLRLVQTGHVGSRKS